MPKLRKVITLEVPASAIGVFEALTAEEGYELVGNPAVVAVEEDLEEFDLDGDDGDDGDDADEDDNDDEQA